MGPITVTVTAPETLLGQPVPATVRATGRRPILVNVLASATVVDRVGNATIELNEFDAATGLVVEGGARAVMKLTTETLAPEMVVVGQAGSLEITQPGSLAPIGSKFALANCRGVL
jgi:hypothetical protein